MKKKILVINIVFVHVLIYELAFKYSLPPSPPNVVFNTI